MNPVRVTQLLTLMLILALAACGQEQGPAQTVEGFLSALEAGDISKAQEYLSADVIGEDSAWVAMSLREASSNLSSGDFSARVISEEIDGDMAVVTVEARSRDGEVQQDAIPVILEDEKWKLLMGW